MRMKNSQVSVAAGEAPAHADLIFLLADLLRRPSPGERARWAEAMEMRDDLLAAAGFADDAQYAALGDALTCASVADHGNWSDEFHRLFEGTLACPPNETAYIRRDKGAIIADICGFYRAFGFAAEAGEKPDHIVTQLEFQGVLLAMLSAADDPERRDVTMAAAVEFADAHLGQWIGAFLDRLEETSRFPLYPAAAVAIRETWRLLSDRYGFAPGSTDPMPPELGEPEPLQCGLAEEAAARRVPLMINGRDAASAT